MKFEIAMANWLKGKSKGNGFEFENRRFEITKFELAFINKKSISYQTYVVTLPQQCVTKTSI